jgi:hypothetical protein
LVKYKHQYTGKTSANLQAERRGIGELRKPQFCWLPKTVRLKITYFLDMFSGNHAPLTVAMAEQFARCLIPQDAKGFLHFRASDLSDGKHVNFLLRLAWTGVIGVANSSPPCETYSAIREQPGAGPPQLRSEEDVAGTWLTDPKLITQVQEGFECHYNSCLVLWVVHIMGGFIGKENPPASLDNYEDCVRALILRTGMKLVTVAACHPRYVDDDTAVIYEKHFLWATTIPGFEKLGTL